jgi:hypothetical protein
MHRLVIAVNRVEHVAVTGDLLFRTVRGVVFCPTMSRMRCGAAVTPSIRLLDSVLWMTAAWRSVSSA